MKHGSITSQTRQKNNQNNGLKKENQLKNVKSVASAGKVMVSVFWGAHGIIFLDYLEKGKTINDKYYANLLQHLSEEIKQKRLHMAKKKALFCQDNAIAPKSVIAMTKINECKFELLPHASYSPDLAPLDYFLFSNLKKWLSGQQFSIDEEVILAVNGYFEEQDCSYNKKGIELIEHCWGKYTELKGGYVEK
ncbi:mariner Mos1 transposase [Trichonephila clavipes]|nr:mariner Mos1 transposase [Trichonephila clavipes]